MSFSPTTISSAIFLAVCGATALAAAATWRRRLDRGLIFLRWYFFLALAQDGFTHLTLLRFGYASLEYRYVYWGTDLALLVAGYFALARLVELVFEKSSLRLPGLRAGSIMLFSGLAVCSALIVYLLRGGLATDTLERELEQNFSFLGMVLAIVLFFGLSVLRVRGVRFRRLVLSFSFMYGSGAMVYSLALIFPKLIASLFYTVPLTGLVGMSLISYSLLVPEPVYTWQVSPALQRESA